MTSAATPLELDDAELVDFDEEMIVRMFPHTFAPFASLGKWKPYDYLVKISEAIAEAVLAGKGRIVVSIPPRHGKSELISKWVPTWYLDMNPAGRVMLASYEADFAAHWGRQVRTFFEVHTDMTQTRVNSDSHAANRWETTDGGAMHTAGVGGAFTGKGADLLIIDDPVKNWVEAMSPGRRQLIQDWFLSTFYTRAEPNATIIVLMTRWHEDDLAGYLIKEHEDDWHEIKMPAITKGVALCPERYTVDDLRSIRSSIGPFMYGALYDQNPVPLEGGIFKRNWFKFWTPDTLPEQFDKVIQSWDFPFDDTDGASFASGQPWAKKGADHYLLGEYHDQCDFPEMKRAVKKMSEDHPEARTKVIENKAAGAPLIKDLKAEVPGMVPWNPRGSKIARAMSVTGIPESGHVYLPHPSICPWVKDWLEEVCTFPKAKLKDRVDSFVQALLYFNKGLATGKVGFVSMTRASPVSGVG